MQRLSRFIASAAAVAPTVVAGAPQAAPPKDFDDQILDVTPAK